MSIEITLARKAPARAELVGLAITSDEVGDKPHGLDWDVLEARGFDGSVGQAHIVSSEAGPVVALGMGAADEMNELELESAALRLAPIDTGTGFNHLSVRSAMAILVDRLLGELSMPRPDSDA